MGNVFSTSVGRKLIMSISGLFLLLFLSLHLSLNLISVFSADSFNEAAHFMATTPLIKGMQPVLFIGFIVHIVMSIVITIRNQKARPKGYAVKKSAHSSSWASRNMFVLGALIFVFLIIHLLDFFTKIQFGYTSQPTTTVVNGVQMDDTFAMLRYTFTESPLAMWSVLLYVVGAIVLALHISHALWAAFQTMGSSTIWRKRLHTLSIIVAVIYGLGYAIIPVIFFVQY